jgi:hypothetical protein
MPPLDNNRHERFVQGLLEGKSASQAYADAGYKPDDGNAAHLRAKEKVKRRLAELQGEVVKETKLTVESLIGELEAARQQATNLKQLSAAVSAVEAKARIGGMMIQKVEVGSPGSFDSEASIPEIIKEMCDHECDYQPELKPYLQITDEDRAQILHHFEQIFAITARRRQEAHEARNQDLMRSYHPTITRTHRAIGNGKAS